MSKPIYQVVDDLPTSNLTVRVLKALDWVVPGHWDNLVGFENTIKAVSGEDDPELVKKIGNGVAASEAKKWDPKGPLPMVFMHVWKDKISKNELDDLATWLLSTAKKDDTGF